MALKKIDKKVGKKLESLYAKGLKYVDIASRLKLTYNQVHRYIKNNALSNRAGKSKYSEKFIREIDDKKSRGWTWAELARFYKMTQQAITDVYHKNRFTVYKPKIVNPKIDLWEAMKAKSEHYIESFQKKNVVTIKFPNKFIAVCFPGDPHIGHTGCNYKLMEQHARLIGNTPNAYSIIGGDHCDLFIRNAIMEAVINANTTPKEQLALLQQYIDFYNGHILAMISGNHDRRVKEVSGLDYLAKLTKGKILYSPEEFRILLNVNGIKYRLYIRHKYRFNSNANLTNCVKRLLKEGEYEFDIGVVAHNHEYAMESFLWRGKERIAIRTSCYKIADPYTRKIGYNSSVPLIPMVILSPDKKNMFIYKDLEKGLEFLKYLNNGKR